jgi:DNA-binding transcriptional ArsR family regulator
MDVEVRQLRYFVVIAEELNFSRAAKRLSLTQPALSLQVQRLEEALGVILFERNRRRMRLSESGKLFLQLAQQTLARLEQGLEEVRRMGGSSLQQLDGPGSALQKGEPHLGVVGDVEPLAQGSALVVDQVSLAGDLEPQNLAKKATASTRSVTTYPT